jgi:hypothetical protein
MDQPDSAPLPAAPETGGGAMRLVGTTLGGRYKVLSLLGEGGMGAVYLVEHVLMRKRMALKVLNAELSKNREMVARFEREAMAAAHLEHPNVVAATDLGFTDDGALFLVLEFIDGKSLRDVLELRTPDCRPRHPPCPSDRVRPTASPLRRYRTS